MSDKPFWCRLGIHTAERSQGVVGYCLRGCGDLKRWDSNGRTWTRYVEPPADRRILPPAPMGLPPLQSPAERQARALERIADAIS